MENKAEYINRVGNWTGLLISVLTELRWYYRVPIHNKSNGASLHIFRAWKEKQRVRHHPCKSQWQWATLTAIFVMEKKNLTKATPDCFHCHDWSYLSILQKIAKKWIAASKISYKLAVYAKTEWDLASNILQQLLIFCMITERVKIKNKKTIWYQYKFHTG